jgi:hypothetical protein
MGLDYRCRFVVGCIGYPVVDFGIVVIVVIETVSLASNHWGTMIKM